MASGIRNLNPSNRQERFGGAYEFSPEDRLSRMPDLALREIVYHLVFDTKGDGFERPVFLQTGYHALGLVNRRLNDFVFKDPHTRGVFVKALLDRCRSLSPFGTDFRSNLTLESLQIGFRLYLEDPNNEFSKLFRLDQRVCKLVFEIFEKAQSMNPSPSIVLEVTNLKGKDFVKWENSGYREYFTTDVEGFLIDLDCESIRIVTPFREILIEKAFSEGRGLEQSPYPPVLAIAEFLINRLGASLDYISLGEGDSYELSAANFSGREIRRVKERDLKIVTRKYLEKSATGSQRVIVSPGGFSLYDMDKIGLGNLWEDYVLEIALFALENKYALPRSQMLYQTRSIAELFWGKFTCDNVIVSLFERSKLELLGEIHSLKSLEEIHAFMLSVVMKMHKERGMSKKEIVRAIDLPFVNLKHPFFLPPFEYKKYGLLAETGIINAYESGKSNWEVISNWKIPRGKSFLDQQLFMIGTYFWGEMLDIFLQALRFTLGLNRSENQYKLFKELCFRLVENGESREKILKDLGLPSASYLYHLIKDDNTNTPRRFIKKENVSYEGSYISGRDFSRLVSMINRSLVPLFLPYTEARKRVNEMQIRSKKE